MSLTFCFTTSSNSFSLKLSPLSFAKSNSDKALERGKLPTCVVKIFGVQSLAILFSSKFVSKFQFHQTKSIHF